jgi:predicted transcriptional regulator
MKTRVADTSLATYRAFDAVNYLQPRELEVMTLMRHPSTGALTREQIAKRLNWKESAVCGRCNSLVTKGQLEEFDGGRTASGRTAKLLRVPVVGQKELFQ